MASDQQLSEVLREFARTMVTDFPIQGILDHLVERIVDIMPVTGAGVTLISPGVDPRYVAASNQSALEFEQLQTELSEGPCLAAYTTGEAVAVPDLRLDKRFPKFGPRASDAGLAAVFTFPLRHGERRLGALDLYRDRPGRLTAKAMTAAQTLADVVAAYLLNAQARADLQDSSNRARQAALHDALTGLPNRVLLLELLKHAVVRAQRTGKTPVVLFFDLDRFKAVNDTHGHRVGDELLVAIADRLRGLLRNGDTLARLYGDEFVVLCEDLDTTLQADAIAERLGAALVQPFVLSGVELEISASVGLVPIGADVSAEEVLDDADLAMYQAKRQQVSGRQVLDLRDHDLGTHQTRLNRDLHGIIGRGELHLAYQPIVETATGRITGAEALVRWMHPSRGLVPPTVLIPLAEQSGLIIQIGTWVLKQAWSDLERWQPSLAGGLVMSVNVSPHQIMATGFADTVATVLEDSGTDPRLLTLEVTESVFVRNSARALAVLSDVKAIGVNLALDDFGTGYSSLSYLKQLPIDIVKIDRTFVSDLGGDSTSRTIVRAIIGLAHGLGMTVVAEGVETAEQHHVLMQLRCDSCQGFYFDRPMSAASLARLRPYGVNEDITALPI